MSCPGCVDSSFMCPAAMLEYFDEEGNSREVYAHRGLIQEEEAVFDPDDAFYNYLKTLRFVKFIDVVPTLRSYIVWVHEDTKLATLSRLTKCHVAEGWCDKTTSVFALGFRVAHEDIQYDQSKEGHLPYDEERYSDGHVRALNKNPTDPVPAQHICERLVHEAYIKHKGVSSIREATCGFYGISIGPEPGDEYYYPIPASIIMRTYIIKF
jgi:hypothetical protein